MKDVLCVILGGGRGTRLYPLTKYRAKPAVPVAGKYRLIDIPVSNCINSGLNKIFVLTQFKSASLNKHIARAYKLDSFSGGFVDIIAAEQSEQYSSDWFQGSADAVRKSFRNYSDPHFKYILILSGDQLYRMDFSRLLATHLEKNSAVTVACNLVDKQETPELGIMGIDKNGRIRKFLEKPAVSARIDQLAVSSPVSSGTARKKYLASMGIYLFNKDVLAKLLFNSDKNDFGKEIIPEALKSHRVHAFVHDGYWKDIGSIKSFYEENLAFISARPPLDMYDEDWQFFTRPRFLPLSRVQKSTVESCNIADGAIIDQSSLVRSIVGLRSYIRSGSVIEDTILMGNDYYEVDGTASAASGRVPLGIGRNCHIRRAIVDKNVRIGDNVRIVNKKNLSEYEDRYCVIRSGIIIIPKDTVIPAGTVI